MSRVSMKAKHLLLRHETRILQLLKGHATIPSVYAYGQLEHFECIAMEILGPGVAERQKKNGSGTGVMLTTVNRIMDQVLAGLEHIHSLGIVHPPDIKPENLLCALDNSTIQIIDFGISKPFSQGPLPSKSAPITLSINLIHSYICHTVDLSHQIVQNMKSSCSGKDLSDGFPVQFGDLLDHSLDFNQLPDYGMFRRLFASLAGEASNGPFDWTPCYPKLYPGMDLDVWDLRRGERDKNLTLLAEEADLDSCIPIIAEVPD
ncbi:kinase-like protein [Armillaria mellea]|nr:kinase-like protein [Armillaria mellea]